MLCKILSNIGIECGKEEIEKIRQELKNKEEEMGKKIDSTNSQNKKLQEDLEAEKKDKNKVAKELVIVSAKYDLIGKILNAKSLHNEALKNFDELCKNDFIEFANNESSLAEEAEALLKLQSIQEQLHVICNFPAIFNKTIVALGGGFSSGKSAFLNSIIANKDIRLATGIKPVTALPTYISNGSSDRIKIYSTFGGSVDIEPSLYKEISHDFIKSFSFNLKDIVPFMAIETKIGEYNNLCFIDTPGYNPVQIEGQTDRDFEVSKEYLKKAKVLLWAVGLDSNGTISTTDLEFLSDFMNKDKKLFIILNKADLKTPSDVKDIIEVVKENLKDYDIKYEGISAYSSTRKKEIMFDEEKISLFDFLKQVDKVSEVKRQIEREVKEIFEMYDDALNESIAQTKDIHKQLKSLELDLYQDNYTTQSEDEDSISIDDRIDYIRKKFSVKEFSNSLKQSEKLQAKIFEIVGEIFASIKPKDKLDKTAKKKVK